ncbi:unnamed protein product [Toxocara canis]|uniref:Uncharacterized protein n=1 Tax=Toxocara canis TaxID=6265 RepID=A0A183TVR9_TOXCA|nr:unnamed protein product [Toxocara canis]
MVAFVSLLVRLTKPYERSFQILHEECEKVEPPIALQSGRLRGLGPPKVCADMGRVKLHGLKGAMSPEVPARQETTNCEIMAGDEDEVNLPAQMLTRLGLMRMKLMTWRRGKASIMEPDLRFPKLSNSIAATGAGKWSEGS